MIKPMTHCYLAAARIDLPPLDQFGPWPIEAGRFVRRRRHRLDEQFENDDAALPYYLGQAHKAWAVADEERARRLELEAELAVSNKAFLERTPPVELFIERKVYTPMPPREVRGRTYAVERSVPLTPSIVVTPPRSRKFFGRLGDRIDSLFGSKRTIHVGMSP